MGLAERRRIAAYKDEQAKYAEEIKQISGLPFEIDFESFPQDKAVLDCYDSYADSYGPGLMVKVVQSICADDMGKEALAEKFDRIVFRNAAKSADDPGDKSVDVDGKTLIVTESFYGYSDKLYGESELVGLLENML